MLANIKRFLLFAGKATGGFVFHGFYEKRYVRCYEVRILEHPGSYFMIKDSPLLCSRPGRGDCCVTRPSGRLTL